MFASFLDEIGKYAAQLKAFRGEPAGMPRWNQDWFPRLDGAAAYAMVRSRQPGRIVEIGSGHSTRFMAQAVRDGGFECRITAVDPAPRASLRALGNVHHVAATLQAMLDSRAELFDELAAGDVLFVDSSHILMPGSDVDLLVNRVFPRLPAGLLIHVHDILLPDDYPRSWTWRAYNEQSAIAPLLTAGACEALFASRYVSTRMADALSGSAVSGIPLEAGALETSLWLMKRT